MITSFSGEYRFLSNFWVHPILFEGMIYPSNEHAYVAAKTIVLSERELIQKLETPAEAKKYGRTIDLRPGWNQLKVNIMRFLVSEKFKDESLFQKLKETAPHDLIEGNNWGDTFWGQCPLGEGCNWLGKLLMETRDDPFR